MILRRITEHIKAQNWTAVALDFFIVVMGVFIGLQVQEWNVQRSIEAKGRADRIRLIEVAEVEMNRLKTGEAYYVDVRRAAEQTIALLTSGNPVDPNALVVNAYHAGERLYQPQSPAVFNEIVASGGLAYTGGPEFRTALAEFYSIEQSKRTSSTIDQSPYRSTIRGLLPHAVQEDIRRHCGDIRNDKKEIIGLKTECVLTRPEIEIAAAAEFLLSDPTLLQDLQRHYSLLDNAVENQRQTIGTLKPALEEDK